MSCFIDVFFRQGFNALGSHVITCGNNKPANHTLALNPYPVEK